MIDWEEQYEQIYYDANNESKQIRKDEEAMTNGYTIRCCNCETYLVEEDLVHTTIDYETLDACPNCMTDEYLMDLK